MTTTYDIEPALTHDRLRYIADHWTEEFPTFMDAVFAAMADPTVLTEPAQYERDRASSSVHPPSDFALIQREASDAFHVLETLTTDEFAHGGDRPVRASLVRILHVLGAADAETLREYGVAP